MTKDEAIKYLRQIYPNGGHCWLDEQQIEAIGMAVNALQEEPVSESQSEKELGEAYLAVFDKKFTILPSLSGRQLADYKNFLNKCQQIFGLKEWGIRPVQSKLFEKLTLLWATWGAEHLQGIGRQDEKEQDIPVSEELEKVVEEIVDPTVLNAYGVKEIANRLRRTMIEPVSKDLEEVIEQLAENARKHKAETSSPFFSQTDYRQGVIDGAKWQKEKEYTCYEEAFEDGAKWKVENLWKPADGDDLPIIDREVIALLDNGKVVFAHRPPEYWDGKNIVTGKVTRNYPKTYDKGGWNIPNVKWWLDVKLPKEMEL